MNIQGFGPGFEARNLQPRRAPARETAPESPAESLFGKDNPRLPVVLTGFKSEVSTDREAGSSAETTETRTETSVEDSAPEQDNMEDLSRDYEPVGERDEDADNPEDSDEDPPMKKGRHLDVLEAQCRARFLLLDQLLDRLAAAHPLLRPMTRDRS